MREHQSKFFHLIPLPIIIGIEKVIIALNGNDKRIIFLKSEQKGL